ncbi:MAG: hypothetical protein VW498_02140 [Candidatus Thalassarchaeaceae archaeon]
MGKFSRDKGARVERKIVNALREAGIDASRVPLSGSAGGRFAGDVDIRHRGKKIRGEVKSRKNGAGFSVLQNWLDGADILFCHQNNKEPIVVMPISKFINIMGEEIEKKESNSG